MTAPIASGGSESPSGPRTHWKAPPFHGARRNRSSAGPVGATGIDPKPTARLSDGEAAKVHIRLVCGPCEMGVARPWSSISGEVRPCNLFQHIGYPSSALAACKPRRELEPPPLTKEPYSAAIAVRNSGSFV